MNRNEMAKEISKLCKADGIHVDEEKLAELLNRFPETEVERMLEAFYRFGPKDVIEYIRNSVK